MKSLSLFFGVAAFSILAGTAFASPWGHVRLESTDGTQIMIDFQTPQAVGNTVLGADLYLNVITPAGSDCEAPVRAVINSSCGGSSDTKTVDLIPTSSNDQTCYFTIAQTVEVPAATHAGVCDQQLSLVVKGDWLTDSVNGTHNFHFTLPFLGN